MAKKYFTLFSLKNQMKKIWNSCAKIEIINLDLMFLTVLSSTSSGLKYLLESQCYIFCRHFDIFWVEVVIKILKCGKYVQQNI